MAMRSLRGGRSKWIVRSNRPGRISAGSRPSARLVAAKTRTLAGFGFGRGSALAGGSSRLTPSIILLFSLSPPVGQIEALHLHEQFVDDPGRAFAHAAGAHARAGHADGVELLDEPDGAALGPCRLAQRLEELTDLAVGHAVEVRLELAGRHEQERHLGLGGDRLGQVGLAGTRGALEQHTAAWRTAHLVGEGLVVEEQVQRVDRLSPGCIGADDVGQTNGRCRTGATSCAATFPTPSSGSSSSR